MNEPNVDTATARRLLGLLGPEVDYDSFIEAAAGGNRLLLQVRRAA